LHTGEVRVSPYLPFGGDNCNLLKASGVTTPKKDWIWLPVSVYLIEHPKGLILFDTGWHRSMSPEGVYDKVAQIKSLGSRILYNVNQGQIPLGEAVDEQLESMGIQPADLDYVLLFSDGGYATKSWKEMITSGVSLDKEMQRKSLQWIREQSMDANCIESLATHDTDIKPHVIEL
jgi:hypothetical protein